MKPSCSFCPSARVGARWMASAISLRVSAAALGPGGPSGAAPRWGKSSTSAFDRRRVGVLGERAMGTPVIYSG